MSCPKCGYAIMQGPSYAKIPSSGYWSWSEVLQYTCMRCGYVRQEPTKDREEKSKIQTIMRTEADKLHGGRMEIKWVSTKERLPDRHGSFVVIRTDTSRLEFCAFNNEPDHEDKYAPYKGRIVKRGFYDNKGKHINDKALYWLEGLKESVPEIELVSNCCSAHIPNWPEQDFCSQCHDHCSAVETT